MAERKIFTLDVEGDEELVDNLARISAEMGLIQVPNIHRRDNVFSIQPFTHDDHDAVPIMLGLNGSKEAWISKDEWRMLYHLGIGKFTVDGKRYFDQGHPAYPNFPWEKRYDFRKPE